MLTMNHVAAFYLKALNCFSWKLKSNKLAIEKAEQLVDKQVAVLLLPDAIRMYMPRQASHFTEHPFTKKASTVKFNNTPDHLKGIKDNVIVHVRPHIPSVAIDERSYPDRFANRNPEWKETAYMTHLQQDRAWDTWIRKWIDTSGRFRDTFTYRKTGRTVDGATLRKELGPLDNILFQKLAKQIQENFGVQIDEDWFETHVATRLKEEYDQELFENTWKYINLPSMDEEFFLPEFVSEEDLDQVIKHLLRVPRLFDGPQLYGF